MGVTIRPWVTQETEDSRTLNYTHGRARYTLVQTREDFQDDSPGRRQPRGPSLHPGGLVLCGVYSASSLQ